MGRIFNRNLIFVILLLVIIPASLGVKDSIIVGGTKTYTIGDEDWEVTCYGGSSSKQFASYLINGGRFDLEFGDPPFQVDGDIYIKHLDFVGRSCQFALGPLTDCDLINECSNLNEKFCERSNVWSCQLVNNCLRKIHIEECDFSCNNGNCVTLKDSINMNQIKTYTSSDGRDYEIVCENGDSSTQSATYSVNGEIATLSKYDGETLSDGLIIRNIGFNNGACSFELGSSIGCSYNNPQCPLGYTCSDNKCKQIEQEEPKTLETPPEKIEEAERLEDTKEKPIKEESNIQQCSFLMKLFGLCADEEEKIEPSQGEEEKLEDTTNDNNIYDLPVVLVHGHFALAGSRSQGSEGWENVLEFNELVKKLKDDFDGFAYVAVVTSDVNLEEYKEDWCKTNNDMMKKKGMKQRLVPMSYYFANIPTDLDESKSISEYSDRLKKAVDVVSDCTQTKVNVIAHSMGGLVTREYIRKYGNDKISKVIMLGTPNHGIWNRDNLFKGAFGCSIFHPGLECNDMAHNSNFLKRLNSYDLSSDTIEYYTIAGKNSKTFFGKDFDGVVRTESVFLERATNLNPLSCGHNGLILPSYCPEAYNQIVDILEK